MRKKWRSVRIAAALLLVAVLIGWVLFFVLPGYMPGTYISCLG